MKKLIQYLTSTMLLALPSAVFAWQWLDLWQTADQQAAKLLKSNKPQLAAEVFKNEAWKATANYRAENYEQALQHFAKQNTSDGQYNAGNSAAHLGRYQDAIKAYDKAIALNPNNKDAEFNREIIKKLLQKKKQQNTTSNSKKSDNSEQKEKQDNNKQQTNNESAKQKEKQDGQNDNEKQTANSQPKSNNENNDKQANNSASKKQNNSDQKQDFKNPASGLDKEAQAKEEDKQQIFRRVADDPGGLLRQKFLRDYFRRHAAETGEGEI